MPSVMETTAILSDAQTIDLRSSVPLRPFIFGPEAALHRYSVADEKSTTLLGSYDPDNDTTFLWPSRSEADSVIDLEYSKMDVVLENAKALYYTDTIGITPTIYPVSGYTNRITNTSLTFKSYTNAGGTEYPHSTTQFVDRGVKEGDALTISGTVSSVTYDLDTTVKSFVNDVTAASIASAAASGSNKSTQSASATFAQASGHLNQVTGTALATAYDGSADGYISDTYTVVVTTGGVEAATKLSITSASGLDNQTDVTPAAFSSPTSIGTRGGTVTFTTDSGRPTDSGQPTTEFIAGQTWTIVFNGAFTACTCTSGGTFTGTTNTDYILTVARGGAFPDLLITAPATQATASATGGGSSGGSLQAGVYYIEYTYVNNQGETTVGSSESATLTVSAGNIPQVTVPANPTGVLYKNIYLTAAGGASGTEKLYKQYVTGTTTTLTAATVGGTASPPSTNTCVNVGSGDPPLITVTAIQGNDSAVNVPVRRKSVFYAMGSLGVTAEFTVGTELAKGDVYTIAATAAALGAYKTIVLNNDLGTLVSATDLEVNFYIPYTSLTIPQKSVVSPFGDNWTPSQTAIILQSGIQVYDSSWTDSGTQLALPLKAGTAYATFREWVFGSSGSIKQVSNRSNIALVVGTVDPDNPIAAALDFAIQNTAREQGIASRDNTNDQCNTVRYATLAGDPGVLANWTDVLDMTNDSGGDGVYYLVPLTTNTDVHAAIASNVDAQSVKGIGNYRRAILPAVLTTTSVILDSTKTSDSNIVLAKIIQDPALTSTSYTYLQSTSSNANFITNGVVAGDKVRFNYGIDSLGETSYDTYVVASIESEESLRLVTGPSSAYSTAIRTEVWRDLTKDQLVTQLVDQAATYNNSRVSIVWPDQTSFAGSTYEGYVLNAALAGLAGSVSPHQGLSRVEVKGPDADSRRNFFNATQLKTLTDNGVWVVTSLSVAGPLYSLRAVTTNPIGVNNREEMAVRDLDAVSMAYLQRWQRYYGTANVTDGTLQAMAADFSSVTGILISGTFLPRLGSVLSDAVLNSLTPDSLNLDRINASITATLPKPFNEVDINIQI